MTQDRREAKNRHERNLTESIQDIGSIPGIVNQARRDSCENDLRKYCETYHASAFDKAWGDDQLLVIQKLEQVVLRGGQIALAMPRGSGKTTLAVKASEWALLYGHRRWVALVGATSPKAIRLLRGIRTSLRFNDLLLEDFPEVCFPLRKLEGQARRAIGQKTNGIETLITWENEEIVFPTVVGSKSSGSVITVAGITGDIRGQQKQLADGSIIRPDIAICDDPQTKGSASSATQTADRLGILNGDILGLAGPGVCIAVVVPITVIANRDMADQLMDRTESPEWDSVRTKMLYGEPSGESIKLWDTYREIRHSDLLNNGDGGPAREFYGENQDAMDDGLRAGWPARMVPTDISAIQHAMDLRFRNEAAFLSEYQNQPQESDKDDTLTAKDLARRVGYTERYVAPATADRIVAFIDVQKEALFYVIMSFSNDYTGTIIDYGAWPEQGTTNFVYGSIRHKLSELYRGAGFEDVLKEGLSGLCETILDRTYRDDQGDERSISRVLVDANWGQSRNAIYRWCITCKWKGIVLPSHGKFVGASTEPLNANVGRKPGIKIGTHWRISRTQETGNRYVLYDANFWKSFVFSRFATEPGRRGSLVFYSARPHVHETIIGHCKAEYPVRVMGRGREVDEWKMQPGAPDNHWFDGIVGCHVAAGIEGCTMGDKPQPVPRTREPGRPKGLVTYL